MNQRLISFGNSTISIQYENGRPADLIDFLFQKIPAPISSDPWTHLRLERQISKEQGIEDPISSEGFTLWQDGKLLIENESFRSMAYTLMSQVCFTLAYDSREGLLLHAAAVQIQGRGIILPGKTGAGKSTLTAWLLSQGGRYLTDELVYLPTGSDVVCGFSRPITFKRPARHLLSGLLSAQSDASSVFRADPVDMIFPESFGSDVLAEELPPDLIVFPNYQPDRELELHPLSKALAAYELMKCLANARNLDDHGLSEAVRLADMVPAYSLSFSNLEQAGETISQLLQNQSARR